MDSRNCTSHINLSCDNDVYTALNNSIVKLNVESFSIEENLIMIKYLGNCHFTIVFKRGIGTQTMAIKAVINEVLSEFPTQEIN